MDGNEEKRIAVKKKIECENSQSSKGIERILFKRRNTAVHWNSKIELDSCVKIYVRRSNVQTK